MIRQLAVIATVALAAVVIALSSNQTPGAQGTPRPAVVAGEALSLTPGDILRAEEIDFIDHPGRYGLGAGPRGSRYAIVGGKLVRVDPETMKLQSILRPNIRSAGAR